MKQSDYDKQIADDRRWYTGLLNDVRLLIALPIIVAAIVFIILVAK